MTTGERYRFVVIVELVETMGEWTGRLHEAEIYISQRPDVESRDGIRA